MIEVPADPWPWPLAGPTSPSKLALVVIDMQHDFVADDGWFGAMGFDLGGIRAIVPTIAAVLGAARAAGMTIVHTRQGNAPDLSDLPPVRLEQGRRNGHPIGTPGPRGRGLVRGEPGWEIIDDLAPAAGELVIDKPGYSSFAGTDLESRLRALDVEGVMLAGVTANVCVLATLLGAVDLGFDCLVVADGIAAVSSATTSSVLDLVRYQGGLFGRAAPSTQIVPALAPAGERSCSGASGSSNNAPS
jgi:nicotinamidase-related amidase